MTCMCTLQINSRDGYGRGALHYAAERDVSCLEQLVQRGADVNMRDQNEDTALHWAAYKNTTQCVRVLLQASGCLYCLLKCQILSLESNQDLCLWYISFLYILSQYKCIMQTNGCSNNDEDNNFQIFSISALLNWFKYI